VRWRQKAYRDGYTVHYARMPRLFADLDLAHGDGRFPRLFRMLVKVDLLVLDDWGLDCLSPSQRRDLMEIVKDRHGRNSMLITSQLPVTTWHDVIGDPTLGDAILDRIVHNAYRLELDGPSMRKIKAEATEPAAQPTETTASDDKPPKGAKK
jgi:DNA replication protein DnaC